MEQKTTTMELNPAFFETDAARFILAQDNGYSYMSILFLVLTKFGSRLSIRAGGRELPLSYDQIAGGVPFAHKDTVKVALEAFRTVGWLHEDGGILLLEPEGVSVKSLSYAAQKKRRQRARIAAKKVETIDRELPLIDAQVDNEGTKKGQIGGQIGGQKRDKCPPDVHLSVGDIGVSLVDYPVTEEPNREGKKESKNNPSFSFPLEVKEAAESFWNAYPRKTGTLKGVIQWFYDNQEEDYGAILASLEDWKGSEDWANEGARYIPSPINFLRNRKWETVPMNGSSVRNSPDQVFEAREDKYRDMPPLEDLIRELSAPEPDSDRPHRSVGGADGKGKPPIATLDPTPINLIYEDIRRKAEKKARERGDAKPS